MRILTAPDFSSFKRINSGPGRRRNVDLVRQDALASYGMNAEPLIDFCAQTPFVTGPERRFVDAGIKPGADIVEPEGIALKVR